jgi:hypothetical protein
MIIATILTIIISYGLSFLITSGLVYVAILLLNWLGLALVWSWKLSFVVWVLCLIIKILFGGSKND